MQLPTLVTSVTCTPFSLSAHLQNVLQNFINTFFKTSLNPEVPTANSKRGRTALTEEEKAKNKAGRILFATNEIFYNISSTYQQQILPVFIQVFLIIRFQ